MKIIIILEEEINYMLDHSRSHIKARKKKNSRSRIEEVIKAHPSFLKVIKFLFQLKFYY